MGETVRQDNMHVPDINAWFFAEISLDSLLAGAMPLDSKDDLAIDDLAPEEAESFLHVIEEWPLAAHAIRWSSTRAFSAPG